MLRTLTLARAAPRTWVSVARHVSTKPAVVEVEYEVPEPDFVAENAKPYKDYQRFEGPTYLLGDEFLKRPSLPPMEPEGELPEPPEYSLAELTKASRSIFKAARRMNYRTGRKVLGMEVAKAEHQADYYPIDPYHLGLGLEKKAWIKSRERNARRAAVGRGVPKKGSGKRVKTKGAKTVFS